MIDSKVILHDIFYNTSVNFLCIYPLLYTAGMCNVTYIQAYNTYLYGKYFLSTMYNNIICLTSAQSVLLFMSSDWSSHVYAISWSSSLLSDQVTLPAEVQHAWCLLVQRTHVTLLLFSCGRPVLWMLYFQSTELGRSWTWSAPWNATSCHIFLLRMDKNLWTRISQKFLCVILLPHDLCIRNAFRIVMSVRWKNSFLVHFHVLRAIL